MILDKILEEKKKQLEKAKEKIPLKSLIDKIKSRKIKQRNFKSAVSMPNRINLIAEIKKASPSKGILVKKFDPVKLGRIYQKAGAVALSILTEENFFQGKLSFVEKVKNKVNIPILRKDFIFDKYQIYESKAAGADAVLLIARILSGQKLMNLAGLCQKLGLDYMVEVHSASDVKKALKSKAEIIGINNRDLCSFKVDLMTTKKLRALLPGNKIIISESGIKDYKDIIFLKNLGINAVLVGETLLKSNNIFKKAKELIYGHQN